MAKELPQETIFPCLDAPCGWSRYVGVSDPYLLARTAQRARPAKWVRPLPGGDDRLLPQVDRPVPALGTEIRRDVTTQWRILAIVTTMCFHGGMRLAPLNLCLGHPEPGRGPHEQGFCATAVDVRGFVLLEAHHGSRGPQ